MNQQNIILIDKSVNDCYFIANSTNTDTFPIMYSEKSTKQEILNTLTKFTSINRLGILFVSKPSINLFLDDKPFNNVENVDFIIAILKEFNVKNIDYLSCNTLTDSTWKNYYSLLSNENVIVGASETKLGSSQYGGDWILENTKENIENIYFTPQIEKYEHVLDNPYGAWVSGLLNPREIAISGDYLYVSNSSLGTITKVNIISGEKIDAWAGGFSYPYGLAISGDYLYVSNSDNGTISKVTILTGAIILSWVSGFSYPYGLAISGDYLYVTNYLMGTISKVNILSGTIITFSWAGGFSEPTGLAISGDYLYVSNSGGGKISKVNIISGANTLSWVVLGFSELNGIAISGDDMYISKSDNGTILKLNIISTIANHYWASGLPLPYGISINGDYLYVANDRNGTISKININTTYINSSLLFGIASPIGLAISGNDLYITSTDTVTAPTNGSIIKVNISGKSIFATGFYSPFGIAISGDDIYVVNTGNGNISKVNITNPTLITYNWVTLPNYPREIAISGDYMYVSVTDSSGNGTISKVNILSQAITNSWASGFSAPTGLAISGDYLYVSNNSDGKISKVNILSGAITLSWASGFISPYAITISGDDMYVTSSGSEIISKLNINDPLTIETIWKNGFYTPLGITISGDNLYVSNSGNGTIDRIRLIPLNIEDYTILNNYAVLGSSGLSSSATTTIVNGNYGSTIPSYTGTFSGTVDSANALAGQDNLTTLVSSINSVYPVYTTSSYNTGGTILFNIPGRYNSSSTLNFESGATIIFDALGDSNAQFIITAGTGITFNNVTSIELRNGAFAYNIFWLSREGNITFTGTTPLIVPGVFIANTSITFENASTTNGRLYTQSDDITFIENSFVNGNILYNYLVVYDGNDNTNNNNLNTHFPYVSGSQVTVLDNIFFTKSGYKFVNWNTESNGSGTSYSPGNISIITENIIGYAQWTPSSIICYVKGSLILTKHGFVPIETMKAGINIITNGQIYNNEFIKNNDLKIDVVLWISKFKITQLNSNTRPICIKKNALGENKPFKNLYVSPNHSLLINNKMVTAKKLVNGTTIYQDMECDEVEYYHLECEQHSAIFANGILSESYLEVNNRCIFENSMHHNYNLKKIVKNKLLKIKNK